MDLLDLLGEGALSFLNLANAVREVLLSCDRLDFAIVEEFPQEVVSGRRRIDQDRTELNDSSDKLVPGGERLLTIGLSIGHEEDCGKPLRWILVQILRGLSHRGTDISAVRGLGVGELTPKASYIAGFPFLDQMARRPEADDCDALIRGSAGESMQDRVHSSFELCSRIAVGRAARELNVAREGFSHRSRMVEKNNPHAASQSLLARQGRKHRC
jgi:hypothetical protein